LRGDFAAVERLAVERFAVERLAVERFAVERLAVGFVAVDARLAPAAEDLAREVVDRFAVDRFALERFAVGRFAVLRFAVERLAAGLRAPLLREEPDEARAAAPLLDLSSALHLPDITRWAASATASAMIDPNLVALAIMLLAACEAVSAASSPASRILRRADGLALIAAAAAARPAASISLLIAALASLSTVLSADDPFGLDEEREELLRADFAIAFSPSVAEIAL
jgi:hypothetical protein